jgi:hypothetical protein
MLCIRTAATILYQSAKAPVSAPLTRSKYADCSEKLKAETGYIRKRQHSIRGRQEVRSSCLRPTQALGESGSGRTVCISRSPESAKLKHHWSCMPACVVLGYRQQPTANSFPALASVGHQRAHDATWHGRHPRTRSSKLVISALSQASSFTHPFLLLHFAQVCCSTSQRFEIAQCVQPPKLSNRASHRRSHTVAATNHAIRRIISQEGVSLRSG